jgi:hypothetical protein
VGDIAFVTFGDHFGGRGDWALMAAHGCSCDILFDLLLSFIVVMSID